MIARISLEVANRARSLRCFWWNLMTCLVPSVVSRCRRDASSRYCPVAVRFNPSSAANMYVKLPDSLACAETYLSWILTNCIKKTSSCRCVEQSDGIKHLKTRIYVHIRPSADAENTIWRQFVFAVRCATHLPLFTLFAVFTART